MTRQSLAALGTVACALLIVACGGSSSPSTASKPSPSPSPTQEARVSSVDACKLVTESEASAAIGKAVTNMAAQGGASIPGACIYTSSDGSATLFIYAQTYSDSSAADSVQPDQIAAALNGQYGVTDAKPVTGIGDKAFEYTVNSAGSNGGMAIFVFKSNVVLMIVMVPSSSSSALEQLARNAVNRL